MSYQNSYTTKKSLPRLELSNKPTLVITEKLQRQIDFLHQKVGKNEWSGELIIREEGVITQLDDWKIYAEDIFLADVGTPGYTAYEVDKGGFKAVDIVNMYDEFPGLLEGSHRNFHIHTHHSMGTFFSPTDWEQLEDRGVLSNYFLMLIVNIDGKYAAKVAWKARKKSSSDPVLEFFNNLDGLSSFTLPQKEKEEEVLVVMDMNIKYPTVEYKVPIDKDVRNVLQLLSQNEEAEESALAIVLEFLQDAVKHKNYLVDEPFRLRYEGVQTAIEEEKKSAVKTFPSGRQGRIFQDGFDDYSPDYDGFDTYKPYKGKKIGEMSDKEWKDSQESERTWGLKHARRLLNCLIEGSYKANESTWPVTLLDKLDKKLKRQKREEWLLELQSNLFPYADVIFKNVGDEDFLSILQEMEKFLSPYKTQNKLIEEILEVVEVETQESVEYLNYSSL